MFVSTVRSKPHMVIVMFGTNDAKSFNWLDDGLSFRLDYLELIRKLRAALGPAVRIIIMTPPLVYNKKRLYSIDAVVINEVIPRMVKRIAIATDSELVDVSEEFMLRTDINSNDGCDGVHLNDAGLALLVDSIYATVVKVK